jgi:hypothetical protein
MQQFVSAEPSHLPTIHVLFGKGWQGYNDSGKIHVFAFPNSRIVVNVARDLSRRRVYRNNRQNKGAIGDENLLSSFH